MKNLPSTLTFKILIASKGIGNIPGPGILLITTQNVINRYNRIITL